MNIHPILSTEPRDSLSVGAQMLQVVCTSPWEDAVCWQRLLKCSFGIGTCISWQRLLEGSTEAVSLQEFAGLLQVYTSIIGQSFKLTGREDDPITILAGIGSYLFRVR